MQRGRDQWTPEWAVVIGALGSVAAALLCRTLPTVAPWWAPLALAGTATVGVGVLTLARHRGIMVLAHRVLCLLGAGGWASWTAAHGWSATGVVVLLGAALLLGLLAPLLTTDAPTPTAAAVGPRPISPVAALWQERISAVLRRPIRVMQVVEWDNGSGITLGLEALDDDGLGVDDLAPHCHKIAKRARLPHGCTVQAIPGAHQGAAGLKVMLRDHLAEELTLPDDWAPASVLDDWQLAVEPDGTPVEVNLRQAAAVIAGQRGSGKTTLEHRIIAQLARCTDTVVWVIDLNGGGLGWPWASAWATGQASRPVVDWVAGTPEEALLMLDVAVAIAKDRKIAYAREKIAANVDLLPVSPTLPEILVVVDEGGEAQAGSSAAMRVSARLDELVRIGRAEAVSAVVSVLRGTRSMLSADVKVQSTIRLGLRMQDDAEYAHVLNWSSSIRADDLRHVGCGWLRRDDVDRSPVQVRTMRILPHQIQRCAIATAHLRPELDERARQIAGRAYASRWDRCAPQLALLRGEQIEPQPAGGVPTPDRPATPAPGTTAPDDAMRQRIRTRLVEARATELGDDAARALLAGLAEPEPGPGVAPASTRDLIARIVAGAPSEGLTSAEIGRLLESAGVTIGRQHRHELLRQLLQAGRITQHPETRGYVPRGRGQAA